MQIVSKVTREKLYNRNYDRDGLELVKEVSSLESKVYLAKLLVCHIVCLMHMPFLLVIMNLTIFNVGFGIKKERLLIEIL